MMSLIWFLGGAAFAWFVVPDPPSWVVAGKNYVWGKISEMLNKS